MDIKGGEKPNAWQAPGSGFGFRCQKLIRMWITVLTSDFQTLTAAKLYALFLSGFWGPTVWSNFPIYATRLICWREAMCCHRRLPTWLMLLIEIHFLSIRRWLSLSHTQPFCSPFIYRETQTAAAAVTHRTRWTRWTRRTRLELQEQSSKQSQQEV